MYLNFRCKKYISRSNIYTQSLSINHRAIMPASAAHGQKILALNCAMWKILSNLALVGAIFTLFFPEFFH